MCDYKAAKDGLEDLGKELERLRKVEAEYAELREYLKGGDYHSCEHCGRIRFIDDMSGDREDGYFCDHEKCQRRLARIERQATEQAYEDMCRNFEIGVSGLSGYLR